MQIRVSKGLSKRYLADKLDLNESTYGRIESGKSALSYKQLAQIASALDMTVLDVISYPKTFVEKQSSKEPESNDPLEAVLQIRLKKDKRDQVLNLIFGDNNLELLMK